MRGERPALGSDFSEEIKALNNEISTMRRSWGKIQRNSGLDRGDKYKNPDTGINMHIAYSRKKKHQCDILCNDSVPGQDIMME